MLKESMLCENISANNDEDIIIRIIYNYIADNLL